jgi:hypothetical protein
MVSKKVNQCVSNSEIFNFVYICISIPVGMPMFFHVRTHEYTVEKDAGNCRFQMDGGGRNDGYTVSPIGGADSLGIRNLEQMQ